RRRHTRFSRDWSSDVCSSDLATAPGEWPEAVALLGAEPREVWRSPDRYSVFLFDGEDEIRALAPDLRGLAALGDDQFICTAPGQIGRASCRDRVSRSVSAV